MEFPSLVSCTLGQPTVLLLVVASSMAFGLRNAIFALNSELQSGLAWLGRPRLHKGDEAAGRGPDGAIEATWPMCQNDR